MTGKPATAPASPKRPLLKRPVVMTSFAIMLAAAAGAGTWIMRPPEEAPQRPSQALAPPAVPALPPNPQPVAQPRPPATEASPPNPPSPAAAQSSPATPEVATVPAAPPSPDPPPPPAEAARPPVPAATNDRSVDWASLPIAELRTQAEGNSIPAMEEIARRLVQGIGVAKDQQAGAGWLMRAAEAGSAQSAFNVAVMFERGFVMERDSAKAVEWYRKAAAANLAIAKHNLALMLRDGKGAARDGKAALDLLHAAARQGMAASMFTLGDIYERGDAAEKDAAMAMAWFAIAAEFERQTNKGTETALGKTSATRAQALQRGLTPEDLQKAELVGQTEFRRIVETMKQERPLARPAPTQTAAATPLRTAPAPAPVPRPSARPEPPAPRVAAPPPQPPIDLVPADWPKAPKDQVRVIQQALFDLKLLRDKPDGAIGPMTRAAIRTFQRISARSETGEPTPELYGALKEALARREVPPPPGRRPHPKWPSQPHARRRPPRRRANSRNRSRLRWLTRRLRSVRQTSRD